MDTSDMDKAAKEAEKELDELLDKQIGDDGAEEIMLWFKRWYMKAGYKRLGKLIIKVIS